MENAIKIKFDSYPPKARQKLNEIRAMIFQVAEEEGLGEIVESLKWGEPSYASKSGSPIRMDWKSKYPNQVSLFVNCHTQLIATYKEVYGANFHFVGNRELVLPLEQAIPSAELKACILMALKYHKLKKLPLLGA
ncbi:DUF1801 domain-containing protein [Marinomonas sp. THO17]|uniref:DUF1801 domain-containing protein n=1 Tax=Marinomonas sp. THO17 TaxID=3149048 RepID=UPI00336BC03D